MELYGRRSGSESGQQQVEWAPGGQAPGWEGEYFEPFWFFAGFLRALSNVRVFSNENGWFLV